MNDRLKSSGYGLFLFAIAISFAWHILWLSAVKIVAPPSSGPVKFSRVSFLGPVLERGAINVRVQPKEMVFLEKRYQDIMQSTTADISREERADLYLHGMMREASAFSENRMAPFVSDALESPKEEPGHHGD